MRLLLKLAVTLLLSGVALEASAADEADAALYHLVVRNQEAIAEAFQLVLPPADGENGPVTMKCAGIADNQFTSYSGAGSCLVYSNDREFSVTLIIVSILNEGAPFIPVKDLNGRTFSLTAKTLAYTQ